MTHHELPASVRVALWSTEVLAGRLPASELPRRALPDVDECVGLVEPVSLWADLGEQVVLVALPRPGDLSGMPRGASALLDAATQAQECAFVPGVGGAIVPELSTFGPPGDEGWLCRWERFDADPVEVHRLEALDLGQSELALRQDLAEMTQALAGLSAGAPLFGPAAEEVASRARSTTRGGPAWGLPEGLPRRAAGLISLAGTVLALADAGLEVATASMDAASMTRRGELLRQLQARASRALAEATNVAALSQAHQR